MATRKPWFESQRNGSLLSSDFFIKFNEDYQNRKRTTMDLSIPEVIASSIKRYLPSPQDQKFIKDYKLLRRVEPRSLIELIDEYFDRNHLIVKPLIEGDILLFEYLKELESLNDGGFPESESITTYYCNFFVENDSVFFNKSIYESQIKTLKAEIEELKKENADLRQIQDSIYVRDYKLIRKIGSGGFGYVFEVEHNLSGEHFAIKRLHSEDEKEQENILREVKALAPLNQPNVISYKNSFLFKNHVYLVMEYCPNGSMQDRIDGSGKFNEEELIKTFLLLTRAFEELHKKNIIHHDIKPSNFLYSSSGDIKISDFGAVNTSIGTPSYYPPELYLSTGYISDPRTDIFSLGITLMECALGYHPLASLRHEERMIKLKNADLPLGQLPFWLQQVILKAVNFDFKERFQSMREFHEAILKKDIPIVLSRQLIEKEKYARILKTSCKAETLEKGRKVN